LPLNQQLVDAVTDGDLESAAALLAKGAAPDAGDYVTGYALPIAVGKNHLGLVKLLVEQGADVDIAGENGKTPLAKAIKQGNLDIAAYLLGQGALPNQGLSSTDTPPLMLAIQTGRPEMVELLLNHGANPNPTATSLLEATSTVQQQHQVRYNTITQILTEAGAE
jgi:ankyrin repeat protein